MVIKIIYVKALLMLLVISILVVGCANKENDTIKIGLILPLTGPAANLGNAYLEGVQLAVEDLNKEGILKRKIELVVEDTASEPKNAVTAMQKMIDNDKIKFFFTTLSTHGLALKPLAESNEVLLFGDVAHPNMTGDNEFVFRHSNIADDEANNLAKRIIELNVNRAGIIYGNDDYSVVFNKLLTEELSNNRIKTKNEQFDLKGNDFRTQILKLKEDSEVIVVSGIGPGLNILLKQIKESGFNGYIIANVGFVINKGPEELKDVAEDIYYSDYPYSYLDNYDEFVANYVNRYNKKPQPFHSISYGSIELLAHAIAEAKSEDPKEVVEILHNMKEFNAKYEAMKIDEKGDVIIPLIIRRCCD